MANIFGVLVAGRLAQTDCQQVDDKHFLFNIVDIDSVSHVVVFMSGVAPFPADLGGGVYFGRTTENGPSWQLLGYISNQKPSAIYKIAKLKADTDSSVNKPAFNTQLALMPTQTSVTVAQIGISVEPLHFLTSQTPARDTEPSTLNFQVEFTQKMLEHFFNYASSFAITQSQMVMEPGKQFIPFDVMQKWYESFTRRLQQNPTFWKS